MDIEERIARVLADTLVGDWVRIPESSAGETSRDDLREAARSVIAAVGWQPIETAPKDGTAIDVWVPGNGKLGREPDAMWRKPETGPKRGVEQWCAFHHGWSEWVEMYQQPTHWMPLPEPPAELSASAA